MGISHASYSSPPNFDDPRIATLPRWARELIGAGESAKTSAKFWNDKYDERGDELDALRNRYAQEHGAATYDTWVSEDLSDGEGVRFGLGKGRTVEFGNSDDVCGEFTVTYSDGVLHVGSQSPGLTITTSRIPGDLRIALA